MGGRRARRRSPRAGRPGRRYVQYGIHTPRPALAAWGRQARRGWPNAHARRRPPRPHPPRPPLRAFWATDAIAITPCRHPPHAHSCALCRGASANTTRLHALPFPPLLALLSSLAVATPPAPPPRCPSPADDAQRRGHTIHPGGTGPSSPSPPPPRPDLSSSPPPLRPLLDLCTSFLFFSTSPPTP